MTETPRGWTFGRFGVAYDSRPVYAYGGPGFAFKFGFWPGAGVELGFVAAANPATGFRFNLHVGAFRTHLQWVRGVAG